MANANGFFLFEDLAITPEQRWLVNFSKAGYIDTQKLKRHNNTDTNYYMAVSLAQPDIVKEIDLTTAQTVTLNGDQVSIELPSGAVNGGDDASSISITYGDASTEAGASLFPGDYTATNDISVPADILLESIAFVDFSLSDKSSNDLTLLDQPAKVTLRLPPIYQTMGLRSDAFHEGDTIAWWSYNEENGVWLREDADVSTSEIDDAVVSVVDGVLFASAQVTHFSWWNLDRPLMEQSCIDVTVVDGLGDPLPDLEIFANGETYNAQTSGITDATGKVKITVKRSEDSNAPEGFKIIAKKGSVIFEYDLKNSLEGDPQTNVVESPSKTGTAQGAGECTSLQDPFVISFDGTLEGVVYDANGEPAAGQTIQTSLGDSIITDGQGRFTFSVPHLQDISLIIPEQYASFYRTTEENPITSIVINLNIQPVVINGLTAVPSTTVEPGEMINLTIDIKDFDQHVVTWSATAGTITSTGDITAQWTAPSINVSGSAVISASVIAKDQRHASTDITLNWQVTVIPAPLIVELKNFSFNEDPQTVEGIQVMLHTSNGIDVEQSMLTDAQGIVYFGIIDRELVTISIIEPYLPSGSTEIRHNITTISDIRSNRGASYKHQLTTEIADDSIAASCEVGDARVSYQAQFTNIPNDIKKISILNHPGSVFEVPAGQSASEVIEMSLCQSKVDQNFMSKWLLVAQGHDVAGVVTAHSLEIDRLSIGFDAVVVFDLSQRPVAVPVTLENLQTLTLMGSTPGAVARDAFTELETIIDNDNANASIYDLGSTIYYVKASSALTPQSRYQQNLKLTSPPALLQFTLPSFGLDSQQFDAVNGQYSWVISNAQDSDTLTIVRESDNIRWTIKADPTTGAVTLPGVLNALNIVEQNVTLQSMELFDLNSVTGYEHHSLLSFVSGNSLDARSITYTLSAP